MYRAFTRRMFCRDLALSSVAVLPALLSSCSLIRGERKLKYPQSADEIDDFWHFYAEPAFNAQAAIDGLQISGTPEKTERADGFLAVYQRQNDLISMVQLAVHKDRLEEIYIYYDPPISISFSRLELLYGEPRNYGGPVGFLAAPVIIASNIDTTRHRPSTPYFSAYGFEPHHTTVGGLRINGLITVSAAEGEAGWLSNSKNVDWIRFSKFDSE